VTLTQHAELVQHQLESLRDSVKASVDHKRRSDSSYPVASKKFNEAVKQLTELASTIPPIQRSLKAINSYEEKNFLLHGNYEYAIRLLTEIDQAIPIAKTMVGYFQSNQKATVLSLKNRKACGLLNETECRHRQWIESEFKATNIFLNIPYAETYSEQEQILREVSTVAGLRIVIAKDEISSADKLCKICRHLQICQYGIADLSLFRQSVSYELGLLHAFGISTCILLNDGVQKFGDIDGLEHQSYSGPSSLRLALAKWLLSNVKNSNEESLQNLIKDEGNKIAQEQKFKNQFVADLKEVKPPTKLKQLKNYLDKQQRVLDGFKEAPMDVFSIDHWHADFEKMMIEVFGREIKNQDIKACLSIIESRLAGISFYDKSINVIKIKESLDYCCHFIERIKNEVTSADLAEHFEPENLLMSDD